ncbi:uncharacterized protein LOC143446071 isoform X1 [Clavelina lepadiformis]|uniref:uncharacterized protein LOC143446071 isoform X1 n=1 Tax=Clavelina lepadiformis TaxID=159417 RepID=UPI004042DB5A
MIIRIWLGISFTLTCAFLSLAYGQNCPDKHSWCAQLSFLCHDDHVQKSCPKTCKPTAYCEPEATCDKDQLNCDYDCTVTPDGEEVCICDKGYKLNDDQRTCSDIDECLQDNACPDPTKPLCTNTPGSYRCGGSCVEISKAAYYGRDECCTFSRDLSSCGQNFATGVKGPPGENFILGLWSWTVMVEIGSNLCTGALITPDWVITAAHCFSSWSGDTTILAKIALRTTSSNDATRDTQTIIVDHVILHPNYEFPHNDIALIHLESNIRRGGYIRPICLPNGESTEEGSRCWLSGYEAIFYEHGIERTMTDTGMVVTSSTVCKDQLGKLGKSADRDNIVCAEYDNSTQADCPGEIGGPLVCQRCDSCTWYIAGIMSFGDICGTSSSFGAFTAVESYEDWIAQYTNITIRKDGVCESTQASWRPWTQWSTCDRTCNGGTRSRSRACLRGSSPSTECDGNSTQVGTCNPQTCPRWSEYTAWSECSKTCDNGMRTRNRSCIEGSIGQIGCHEGVSTQSEVCHLGPCHHWSTWSSWSECSRTCGEGRRISRRSCVNGDTCKGEDERRERCNLGSCSKCKGWTGWSKCSKSCNRGVRTRSRNCSSEANKIVLKTRPCHIKPCIGKWSDWSSWSTCNVSCGSGKSYRLRKCIDGEIGGRGCRGNSRLEKFCRLGPCNPGWRGWTAWSNCSASCGNGYRERQRVECIGGSPGSSVCPGRGKEKISCKGSKCEKRCQQLSDRMPYEYCRQNLVWCKRQPTNFVHAQCARTCCTHVFSS